MHDKKDKYNRALIKFKAEVFKFAEKNEKATKKEKEDFLKIANDFKEEFRKLPENNLLMVEDFINEKGILLSKEKSKVCLYENYKEKYDYRDVFIVSDGSTFFDPLKTNTFSVQEMVKAYDFTDSIEEVSRFNTNFRKNYPVSLGKFSITELKTKSSMEYISIDNEKVLSYKFKNSNAANECLYKFSLALQECGYYINDSYLSEQFLLDKNKIIKDAISSLYNRSVRPAIVHLKNMKLSKEFSDFFGLECFLHNRLIRDNYVNIKSQIKNLPYKDQVINSKKINIINFLSDKEYREELRKDFEKFTLEVDEKEQIRIKELKEREELRKLQISEGKLKPEEDDFNFDEDDDFCFEDKETKNEVVIKIDNNVSVEIKETIKEDLDIFELKHKPIEEFEFEESKKDEEFDFDFDLEETDYSKSTKIEDDFDFEIEEDNIPISKKEDVVDDFYFEEKKPVATVIKETIKEEKTEVKQTERTVAIPREPLARPQVRTEITDEKHAENLSDVLYSLYIITKNSLKLINNVSPHNLNYNEVECYSVKNAINILNKTKEKLVYIKSIKDDKGKIGELNINRFSSFDDIFNVNGLTDVLNLENYLIYEIYSNESFFKKLSSLSYGDAIRILKRTVSHIIFNNNQRIEGIEKKLKYKSDIFVDFGYLDYIDILEFEKLCSLLIDKNHFKQHLNIQTEYALSYEMDFLKYQNLILNFLINKLTDTDFRESWKTLEFDFKTNFIHSRYEFNKGNEKLKKIEKDYVAFCWYKRDFEKQFLIDQKNIDDSLNYFYKRFTEFASIQDISKRPKETEDLISFEVIQKESKFEIKHFNDKDTKKVEIEEDLDFEIDDEYIPIKDNKVDDDFYIDIDELFGDKKEEPTLRRSEEEDFDFDIDSYIKEEKKEDVLLNAKADSKSTEKEINKHVNVESKTIMYTKGILRLIFKLASLPFKK